jgi:hypothetical protein
MAQAMTAAGLMDTRIADSLFDRALHDRFVEVVSADRLGSRVPAESRYGERILPGPLPVSVCILTVECEGKKRAAEPIAQVAVV